MPRVPPHPDAFKNATERRYARDVLDPLLHAGRIRSWHYEALTLKLGHDCRYTPDFYVVDADGTVELHEIKGFRRDDAMVKLRVCARTHPFPLYLITLRAGAFHRQRVSP